MALREAINLAFSFHYPNAQPEGDAKHATDTFNSRRFLNSDMHIILSYDARLSTNKRFSYSFVKRACNWNVHNLAYKALNDGYFYDQGFRLTMRLFRAHKSIFLI